jgi:ABC-2 type transport system permease protein
MLRHVASFETRYQLRSPLFFVAFGLFFLLTFGSVTSDNIKIGGGGNGNVNSPYAIALTVAILSIFATFVSAAFVANVIVRDDDSGFAPLVRSTRVTKRDYLLGRFAGAFLVAALVLAAVPLGMLVGSWMPWLDREKVGPFVAYHYLYAYFVLGVPSILVTSAAFFALATATRSMMWTYVGVLASVVLYVISRTLLTDPTKLWLAAMTDPYGAGAFSDVTRYWTAAERNTLVPPLNTALGLSRLFWLAVSAALFTLAYGLFRFDGGSTTARAAKSAIPGRAATPADQGSTTDLVASGAASVTRPSGWQALVSLTRFDMAFVFRSPAFFVLVALGMFNAFASLTFVVTRDGTDFFPVTRAIIDVLNGAFTLFPMIVAIYYAGELVWRDQDRRMHEIVGATPAPDWTFVLPKVTAITLVLLAAQLASVAMAVGFQLWHGYTHVQIGRYLLWYVLPDLVGAVELAALSVFVQVLAPQKFIGWAVMLLYIVAAVAWYSAGFEHHLYDYGAWPEVPTSDMNGLGRFWVGRAWFMVYWSSVAFALLVLSHCLWRRGEQMRLVERVRRLPVRLGGAPGVLLAGALAVTLLSGIWIYYNTNILNRYVTAPDRDAFLAAYEKALLPYEKVPEPRITDVKLDVALHPREARAETQGEYIIENRTGASLPVVHVSWGTDWRLTMDELQVEGATVEKDYPQYQYRIFRFTPALKPGERRTIRFRTTFVERGFPNSRPLTRLVANGSFIDNSEISPVIGVSRGELLKDRAKRRKYGLPPDLRPPKLEDDSARASQYFIHDSDWVNADITLSTDADQVPIAPGTTVSDVVQGGRRILHTRTEAPILDFFSMQSGRYAVQRATATQANGQPVTLAVYYYPEHSHNVQRMLDAMRTSIELYSRIYSPFQFKQMRIIEFPAYQSFAQSFAGTVPYSEAIGFVQNHPDHTPAGEEKIDLVTYVTAHEVAHQWWAHQVIGADMQGATMLSETFAQYSAMLVMEKLYGPAMVRKFLKYELDNYLRSRGEEVVEELPLERVENQPYIHYRKGTLVMYWLKESVGEDVVNRALRRLLAKYAFQGPPYPSSKDFIAYLREEAGPAYDGLISDLFEKITVYDMKAKDAVWTRRADGKYEVSFTVAGRKYYADGKGNETEAPLKEPFELGVFTAQPGKKGFSSTSVLAFERRPIVSGSQRFTFLVDHEPKWVGVDPYNKRIDRDSDVNLTAVKAGG